jgi:hypothetical protein
MSLKNGYYKSRGGGMRSRGTLLELFLLDPLRYIVYKLKLISGLLGAFVFFPPPSLCFAVIGNAQHFAFAMRLEVYALDQHVGELRGNPAAACCNHKRLFAARIGPCLCL